MEMGRNTFSLCLVISALLFCCGAFSYKSYTNNLQFSDLKGVGGALMTYYDITKLTCAFHCGAERACGFFFYHKDRMECIASYFHGSLSFVSETGWILYTLNDDTVLQESDAADICTAMSVDGCWILIDGHLSHASVGPAGMWGTNINGDIFHRLGTYQAPQSAGYFWSWVEGGLVMLDVGSDIVWAVNSVQQYYSRNGVSANNSRGSNWFAYGALSWVSVSPSGSLWGVDTSGNLVHRRDSSNALPHGTAWDVTMTTAGLRVDAGHAGVWALDQSGRLFYRNGTYGDTGVSGTEWVAVSGPQGTLTSVSVGTSVVVVVDDAGRIWIRTGLGLYTPGGLAWTRLTGHLKQVEVYETDQLIVLWGVDFTLPYQQIYTTVLTK